MTSAATTATTTTTTAAAGLQASSQYMKRGHANVVSFFEPRRHNVVKIESCSLSTPLPPSTLPQTKMKNSNHHCPNEKASGRFIGPEAKLFFEPRKPKNS